MKRYEQSIRVVTALFATLLGFGLKHLLDTGFHPAADRIPCFIVALTLFLRFLLGSANHYWIEYVKPDANSEKHPPFDHVQYRMVVDFVFLVIFGMIGMDICYASTLEQFLFRLNWFALAAFVWTIYDVICTYMLGRNNRWYGWVVLDFFLLIVTFISYQLRDNPCLARPILNSFGWFDCPPWTWGGLILVIVHIAFMIGDCGFQIYLLHHEKKE